jgi:hypothetical protein
VNKKIKQTMQAAFSAPKPTKKAAFLAALPYPRTRMLDFLLGQAGYIRKRVWLLSLTVMAAVLLLSRLPILHNTGDLLWLISSFLPFLALAGSAELARSVSCRMAELETSCRYDFSRVILARLVIIGAADVVVFIPVCVFCFGRADANPLLTGLRLFLPFLLTCALSLTALGRLRSRDGVYVSGAAACAASLANILWRGAWAGARLLPVAGIAAILLLFWTAREITKIIRKSEEVWSCSLTA